MRVGNAIVHAALVEVQSLEIACVGGVAKTEVDSIGAGIDRRLQRGQIAGRADEFHESETSGKTLRGARAPLAAAALLQCRGDAVDHAPLVAAPIGREENLW